MSKPAAARTDFTAHLFSPLVPGPCSTDVLVKGMGAWRAIVDTMTCPVPLAPPAPALHGPEICYMGSFSVLVNGQMAVRMGDKLAGAGGPNPVVFCKSSVPGMVLIGDHAFGLADADIMADYCQDFCALMQTWNTLTAEERRQGLEDVINGAMAQADVPDVDVWLDPSLAGTNTNGALRFRQWRIRLNPDIVNGPMTQDRATALSGTLYHEARHGEQWYAMAQRRADRGDDAAQIHSDMNIPADIAQDAVDNPVGPDDARGVMGDATNRSVYEPTPGHGTAAAEAIGSHHRRAVLGPTGSYEDYRALPEEQDAWQVGDAVEGVAGCSGCAGI